MNPQVDTITLLTHARSQAGHEETLLHINWQDVTERDLHILARGYILRMLQDQWKNNKRAPLEHTVRVKDLVHEEPPSGKHWLIPPPPIDPRMCKLVGKLSSQELSLLLQMYGKST